MAIVVTAPPPPPPSHNDRHGRFWSPVKWVVGGRFTPSPLVLLTRFFLGLNYAHEVADSLLLLLDRHTNDILLI